MQDDPRPEGIDGGDPVEPDPWSAPEPRVPEEGDHPDAPGGPGEPTQVIGRVQDPDAANLFPGNPATEPTVFLPPMGDEPSGTALPTAVIPPLDNPYGATDPAHPYTPIPPQEPDDPPTAPAADEAPAAKPRRNRRLGWIALAVVLAVALAVGGWLWWDATQKAQREEAIIQTATAYLAAIADADAAAALATLHQPPTDTTLITDEVLSASQEAAALTQPAHADLTVDGTTATIAVSYLLGEEPVELNLALVGDGRTEWGITNGLSVLALTETTAVTVNGAEVAEPEYPVLPGTYTAAPTSDLLQLKGTTTATITNPEDVAAPLAPEYAFTKDGIKRLRAVVEKRFDQCLDSHDSMPEGCPFGVNPGNAKVKEGTVKFTLNNNPWKGFTPAFDPAAMTASGSFTIDITAGATATTAEGLTGYGTIKVKDERGWRVDLSQDPLTVTWF
ncbi:MAG: hypothetical protein ACK5LS_04035 [Propioniciclava sp.]